MQKTHAEMEQQYDFIDVDIIKAISSEHEKRDLVKLSIWCWWLFNHAAEPIRLTPESWKGTHASKNAWGVERVCILWMKMEMKGTSKTFAWAIC